MMMWASNVRYVKRDGSTAAVTIFDCEFEDDGKSLEDFFEEVCAIMGGFESRDSIYEISRAEI